MSGARPIRPVIFSVFAVLLISSACDKDGSTEPKPQLSLVASGRAERGGQLTLRVLRGDVPLPPSSVTITSTNTDVATVNADGIAELHAAGNVAFNVLVDGVQLTLTKEIALPPTIVFEMVAGGNRDIYMVYLDGQGLQQVSTSTDDDRSPATALGRVVFSSTRGGQTDLYDLVAAGSAGDAVTTTTTLSETEPALSPDGSSLAFIGSASGSLTVGKLYLASGDGTGAHRVTTSFGTAGSLEATPAWRPSGDRVAFVTTHNGSADIWVYYSAGDTLAPLVENSAADVEPAWSFDGGKVAFASTRDAADAELYVLDVSTKVITRMTTRAGTDAQPSWLPDGRIVFTSYEGTLARLAWLDPAMPGVTHPIPTGSGDSRKPVSIQWLSQ